MLSGMEMMDCRNLAVPASVMHHIVNVESGANPYAIGVVGARLARQPKNLDEAMATARSLEAKGHNFSLGLAQINRANLGKYGLDRLEKAFDPCANLSVGARILADCYTSAGRDWGRAFSCYYSGNFVTGFRDNYVQRIYDSIRRDATVAGDAGRSMAARTTGTAIDRMAMRRMPIDGTADVAIAPDIAGIRAMPASDAPRPDTTPHVFVPQVHGPNDPPATDAGQADLRKEGPDAALVF